ncbi:unnamed protein product [Rhizophagus irregularis]|nr:unnamed protein product [Rhizophagus irregularis]
MEYENPEDNPMVESDKDEPILYSDEEMNNFTDEEKAAQIKRRTYECSHSRTHTSKKVVQLDKQRKRDIQQVNCPWHMNIRKLKNQDVIQISSVKLEHNHIMNPGIREMAPKFRKFTKEMCEDIEFYVKNGLTSATAIFPLLKAKHPAHPIHKKDLYNAIQKYKVGKQDIVINDASSLLRHLANEKLHNSEWFFEFQLTGNEQRLTSLIWMSPEQPQFSFVSTCKRNSNEFDNEVKYERITKMRNTLPKQTIDDVPSRFFGEINNICKAFLTPHILSTVQNQMKQSFFYDAYLINQKYIEQFLIDDSTYKDGFREDDYEIKQILLKNLIENVQLDSIVEIWQIKPELLPTHSQFVILLNDGSHLCTCNFLIYYGVPCRHFFKVIRKSSNCKFHITLINQRWYNDAKFENFNEESEVITLVKDDDFNTNMTRIESFSFSQLQQIRGEQVFTSKLQNIVSSKAKYGKALGLAKKLLDIAQKLDCFNEVYGMFQSFIDEKQIELLEKVQYNVKENQVDDGNQNNELETEINCVNPLTSRRRGRPPKRYQSEGESQKIVKKNKENQSVNTNDSTLKKLRKCRGCQETGHDLRNCKVLSEKN